MSREPGRPLILFEIEQIERLLTTYRDLLAKIQDSEPDLVELTAIASVLHSFYTGVENIFLTIAKRFDQRVPLGSQWHRDLLQQLSSTTSDRRAVISEQVRRSLEEYLGFRHYYRHAYSFFLDWDEMRELVTGLVEAWAALKTELETFLEENSDPRNGDE